MNDKLKTFNRGVAIGINTEQELTKKKVTELKEFIEKQKEDIVNSIDEEITFNDSLYYLQGLEFAEMKIEEVFGE